MNLTSLQVSALERSLDGLSMRHAAISHNIANLHTPNFQPQVVEFEDSLLAALAEEAEPKAGAGITAPGSDVLLTWQPRTQSASAEAQRLDGNRTTIEHEMSGMALNAIKYNAVATVVSKEYNLLRTIAQAR